jgi:hypothetical protein
VDQEHTQPPTTLTGSRTMAYSTFVPGARSQGVSWQVRCYGQAASNVRVGDPEYFEACYLACPPSGEDREHNGRIFNSSQ